MVVVSYLQLSAVVQLCEIISEFVSTIWTPIREGAPFPP